MKEVSYTLCVMFFGFGIVLQEETLVVYEFQVLKLSKLFIQWGSLEFLREDSVLRYYSEL